MHEQLQKSEKQVKNVIPTGNQIARTPKETQAQMTLETLNHSHPHHIAQKQNLIATSKTILDDSQKHNPNIANRIPVVATVETIPKESRRRVGDKKRKGTGRITSVRINLLLLY